MIASEAIVPRAEKGSVLILALWTLFFLSALAIAVSAHVDSGLRFAGWFKARTASYCLAVAGVEKGIMETMSDTNGWDGLSESWGNQDAFKDVELGGGSFSVFHEVVAEGGAVTTNYGLIDEESRISVNKGSQELIAALMATAGGADRKTALAISSAIIDSRRASDDVLTDREGNNYYQEQSDPFRGRKGEFQSAHELLFVKGMSPALFAKLEPRVTIYGSGKVNINTADSVVLGALAFSCGADAATCASLAEKIVMFREAGNTLKTASASEIQRQLRSSARLEPAEESVLSSMMPLITLQSTCFRGTAEGKTSVSGDKGRGSKGIAGAEICRVEFVYDRIRRMKVYWHEN